jgi:hypothetical protein
MKKHTFIIRPEGEEAREKLVHFLEENFSDSYEDITGTGPLNKKQRKKLWTITLVSIFMLIGFGGFSVWQMEQAKIYEELAKKQALEAKWANQQAKQARDSLLLQMRAYDKLQMKQADTVAKDTLKQNP